MKKRNWLIAVLVLLVVLSTSVMLVACKKDEPVPPEPPVEEELTKGEFISNMLAAAQNVYTVDDAKRMTIDFQAEAKCDDTTAKNFMWKYELVAKANVSLDHNKVVESDKNTQFLVEINAYNKDNDKSTLFAILYESTLSEDNSKVLENNFYVAFPGMEGNPYKINAFSLTKILYAVNPDLANQASANEGILDGVSFNDILNLVLTLAIDDTPDGNFINNVKDNKYSFNISLNNLWNTIYDTVAPLLDGDDVKKVLDQINPAIPDIVYAINPEGLWIPDDAEDAEENAMRPVESVQDLLVYISEYIPTIDINTTLDFNKGIKAAVNATYKANEKIDEKAPTYTVNANINPNIIGNFDDKFVIADPDWLGNGRDKQAFNILNFEVNGTVDFILGTGQSFNVKDAEKVNFKVQADLNPFVLFNGLTMDNIKDLGYISLTADAVAGATPRNLLTLYCNFADEALYLNLQTAGYSYMMASNISFGGRYEFNALPDLIAILSGQTPEVASQASANADENATLDTIKGLLNDILALINVDDIKNDGVLIDACQTSTFIIDKLNELTEGSLTGLAASAVKYIVQGSIFNMKSGTKDMTLAIKINEGSAGYHYGHVTEDTKVKLTEDLFSSLREGDVILKDITPATYNQNLFNKWTLDYGEPLTNAMKMNVIEVANPTYASYYDKNGFMLTGTNAITGQKNVTARQIYLGSTFDPYKVGTQKIRIYYGTPNLFSESKILGSNHTLNILESLGGLSLPILPFNGISYFETQVNVDKPIEDARIYSNNGTFINNDMLIVEGKDAKAIENALVGGTITFRGNYGFEQRTITKDMLTVPTVNGEGVYVVGLKYYSVDTYVTVKLVEAEA